MKHALILLIVFTLTCCGQNSSQNTSKSMIDYSPTIEKTHAKAKDLMNEEFYYSPIDETGPFGNDDGSDTYNNFIDWREEHPNDNPEKFLTEQIAEWDYPAFNIRETEASNIKAYISVSPLGNRYIIGIDAAIIAVAFGQLYLEGTIDKNFRPVAIIAIERQLNPILLNLWDANYQAERKQKLEKMLAVVNKVN